MERFGLDDVQAQAILDMRLRALQGLDREKLQAEYDELEAKIAYYRSLLADPELIKGVLKDELTAIRDKYGDERKTEIQDVEDEIDFEDLIEEEECVYTLTDAGYIKRTPASEYRSQGRGGKGIKAQTLREEDFVRIVFTASTHDYIVFFTNLGRAYRKKGYNIPEAGRNSKGTNLVNLLPLDPGEKVTAMIHTRDIETDDRYLFMVTRGGTVKRLAASAFKNIRASGIRALNLDEGDLLINVCETHGQDNILIATHDGYAICFNESDVRPMGREAVGVRGIRLREGDYVIGAVRAPAEGVLLTVTEGGYGKRTAIDEYVRGSDGVPQRRGGKGIKNYNVTEKTGKVADIRLVEENQDVLLISDDGTMIRTGVDAISLLGRATQGVRLMRVSPGSRLISVATTDKEETQEAETDAPAGDIVDMPEE